MSRVAPLERRAKGGWFGVASIACGCFSLVTSEFLPIGLLSELARDLHVSAGVAGLAVTAPGSIAAVTAPVLAVVAGAVDRRQLILVLTAVIAISNLICATAPHFAIFLTGRLVLGIGIGGLWTFATAAGRQLVPESAGGRATSIISAGVSIGTILGMPAGALLGGLLGWRFAFAATAAIGFVIVVFQFWVLPRIATQSVGALAGFMALAKTPMARVAFVVIALTIGGHFMGYTYLEPFLRDVSHLNSNLVALALAAYAVSGLFGTFAGERVAGAGVRRAFALFAALCGCSTVLAAIFGANPFVAAAAVVLWGFAFGAIPVCMFIWVHEASPEHFESGSALLVMVAQTSLALGSAFGGRLVDASGVTATFFGTGLFTLSGAAVAVLVGGVVRGPGTKLPHELKERASS